MACDHDCLSASQIARFELWLEANEAHHAEKALRLAKIPNRERDVAKHTHYSQAFNGAVKRLIKLQQTDRPKPEEPKEPLIKRIARKIFEL
jgi:hypothetical protein